MYFAWLRIAEHGNARSAVWKMKVFLFQGAKGVWFWWEIPAINKWALTITQRLFFEIIFPDIQLSRNLSYKAVTTISSWTTQDDCMAQLGWTVYFPSRVVVLRPWLPTANATSAAHVNYVPFSWLCLGERSSRWGRDVKPWKISRGLTPYHPPKGATHPIPKEIIIYLAGLI